MDTPNKLINLIREIVSQELSRVDDSVICQVENINLDGTLDVRLLSDIENIIHGVANHSPYVFKSGDYAILYKLENNLNNSFILTKVTNKPPEITQNSYNYNNVINQSGGGGGGGGAVDDVVLNGYSVVQDGIAVLTSTSYVTANNSAFLTSGGAYNALESKQNKNLGYDNRLKILGTDNIGDIYPTTVYVGDLSYLSYLNGATGNIQDQINAVSLGVNNVNNAVQQKVSDVYVNNNSAVDANKVAHINVPISLSDLSEDSDHMTVTESQITYWNRKADNSSLGNLAFSNYITNDDISNNANISRSKIDGLDQLILNIINNKQNKLLGDPNIVVVTDGEGVLSESNVSITELYYLKGVTGPIQNQLDSKIKDVKVNNVSVVDSNNVALINMPTELSQLTEDSEHMLVNTSQINEWDGKQDAINGAGSTITNQNLSPLKILVSDVNGKVAVSDVNSSDLHTFINSSVENLDNFYNKSDIDGRFGNLSYGYVTLNTPQNIDGEKTFNDSIVLGENSSLQGYRNGVKSDLLRADNSSSAIILGSDQFINNASFGKDILSLNNILPFSLEPLNLGRSGLPWNDLYLSGNLSNGLVNISVEQIKNKQDALTFDNDPIKNSNNPVKSGGIYNNINNLFGIKSHDDLPNWSVVKISQRIHFEDIVKFLSELDLTEAQEIEGEEINLSAILFEDDFDGSEGIYMADLSVLGGDGYIIFTGIAEEGGISEFIDLLFISNVTDETNIELAQMFFPETVLPSDPGWVSESFTVSSSITNGFILRRQDESIINKYSGFVSALFSLDERLFNAINGFISAITDDEVKEGSDNLITSRAVYNSAVTINTDQEITGNKSFSQPVGIGTNTPEEKLHVVGNIMLSGSTSSSPEIIFKRGTYTDNYNDWKIVDEVGHLKFYDKYGNSNWREQLRITESGILTKTAQSTISFSEASTLANIASGETHATLMGKIQKWYPNIMNMRSRLEALEYIEGLSNPQIGEESYLSLKSNILQPTVMIDDVSYNIVNNVRTSISRSKGNTKQFNQLVRNGNFVDTSYWTTTARGSISVNNNELTYTAVSIASSESGHRVEQTSIGLTGHKWLISFEAKSTNNTRDLTVSNAILYKQTVHLTNSFAKYSFIGTANLNTLWFHFTNSTSVDVGDNFVLRNVQIFDLTAMGLDSITTAEEFTALYPKEYYPYNAGTLHDSVISGVSLTGKNLFNGEVEGGSIGTDGSDSPQNDAFRSKYIPIIGGKTYYFNAYNFNYTGFGFSIRGYDINYNQIFTSGEFYNKTRTFNVPSNCAFLRFRGYKSGSSWSSNLPNVTICINISDSSFNGNYQPYHLSTISLPSTQTLGGVGTVQDEIQVTKNTNDDYYTIKKIKKVESVNLGTLDWALTSAGDNKYGSTGITNYLRTQTVRALCSKYQFGGTINGSAASMDDKKFYFYYNANNTSVYQYIRDTSFSTAEALKTSLSGVILTYELATPVETTLTTTATLADVSAIRENGGMISVVGNTNEDYSQPDVRMSVVYNSPTLI